MSEIANISFSFKEVATALLKEQGIHEGVWALTVKFALMATNVGENEDSIRPAAILPIIELGLQKTDKESAIAVDAAKVNPKALAKGPD